MKSIFPVTIFSLNKTSKKVMAVFDTGSYYSIIRTDKLPSNTTILPQEITFGTANKRAMLKISGITILVIHIGKKIIRAEVLVSDELGSDMLIGTQTMQSWDISVNNTNGKTKIYVKHDLRDPEINEVV